jgi:hypothetical protein
MIGKFAITLFSLFAWLALPAAGRAFTVKSGLTEGCHERVTIVGYLQTQIQEPSDLELYVPDGPWEEVADYLLRDANYQPRSRSEKFFLFSLLTGVRAPDNEGFSLSNISTLRAIHANPHDQYHHCLRAVDDDYVEGDEVAAQGCHDTVIAQLRDAADVLMKESAKQIGKVPFTLDQYGTFDVDVWLVAYHVGRAAHALEDSFTHTLRTQNLRGIIHVMNYAEAIGGTLHEERDGLPHSSATDGCELITTEHAHPANRDRVFAAEEAVADLLRAAAPILSGKDTEAEVSGVLDKWASYVPGTALGYPEGCIKGNDYCNSLWLELARLHPSGPILGCGLTTGGSRPALGCSLLGLLGLGLAARRARRAGGTGETARAQDRETGARS